jgi:hypothetical protein
MEKQNYFIKEKNIQPNLPKVVSIHEVKNNKKTCKALEEDFFEKFMELEFKLKKEFSMDRLQELVNMHSVIYI